MGFDYYERKVFAYGIAVWVLVYGGLALFLYLDPFGARLVLP